MKFLVFLMGRVFSGALTVLGVLTLCFAGIHLLPGDPAEAMLGDGASEAERLALRSTLHLDLPLHTQYVRFLNDLVRHGLGPSFAHRDRTALSLVADVWPDTLALALCAALIAWSIAIPLALLAATRPGTRTDAAVGIASLVGVALPSLWVGPMLVTLFCVTIPVLPFPGPDARGPLSLLLPSFTLGLAMAGILTRMGRAALREVLREPYIVAARARGLSELNVMIRHALRSALVPLLTVGGAQLASLLGGALITEKLFDRRGVGLLLLESLTRRDIPVVLACVFVIASLAVLVQLVVDIAYGLIDPRIRVA